jgi:glycosyltransferase involved in cell wall biosynthesis
MSTLRVLAVVPYPYDHAPGQRYRIEQWTPYLAEAGIDLTFAPFVSPATMAILYRHGQLSAKGAGVLAGCFRRLRDLLRARDFDAAFVYREALPLGLTWFERWLARRLPIVYDFDDAIYLPASTSANAWVSFFKRPAKIADLCRLAASVTVGNEVLATFARRHAESVTVIPSTIDCARYTLQPRPPNPRPVLGWTGSTTTIPHLKTLESPLRRLRGLMEYELRIVGGTLDIREVAVTSVPWRAASEVEDLRPMDVGLMPLPDDAWSRGKCGMKALQYMALGIPPVVSPLGVNATLVQNGVNGFHATTEDEWVNRVGLLLKDPALRAQLGGAARRTVVEAFSAQVHAPRVAAILRRAAAESRLPESAVAERRRY